MKTYIERHVPPGFDYRQELKGIATGYGLALLWSMGFLIRLVDSHGALYRVAGGKKYLMDGVVMEDFVYVLGSALTGFALAAVFALALIVLHYLYHYQGSSSIYLMRRLPDRMERHRRCITVPLLTAAACLATAVALLLLYYWIYMASTPEMCLAPDQWGRLISAWIGG